MNIVGETSKQVGSFIDALKSQPLSLALVLMNFVLLVFLFYNGATVSSQRQETVKMILAWQTATDKLMASCVAKEVLDSVVDALERQLRTLRTINGELEKKKLEPPKQ